MGTFIIFKLQNFSNSMHNRSVKENTLAKKKKTCVQREPEFQIICP